MYKVPRQAIDRETDVHLTLPTPFSAPQPLHGTSGLVDLQGECCAKGPSLQQLHTQHSGTWLYGNFHGHYSNLDKSPVGQGQLAAMEPLPYSSSDLHSTSSCRRLNSIFSPVSRCQSSGRRYLSVVAAARRVPETEAADLLQQGYEYVDVR